MTLAIVNVLPEPVTPKRLGFLTRPDACHELFDCLRLVARGLIL